MELDEMKALWQETAQETARRLDGIESGLQLDRVRRQRAGEAATRDRSRSKLRFVRLVLGYEIACGVLVALLAGSYLYDNLGTLRFALPGALLHFAALLNLGAALGQLVMLGRIDFAAPVVESQRRLAEVGLLRARANRWLLLSAPLLWALAVVVVPHGLAGFDVYRAFGLAWVAANFVFGVAVLAGAAWVQQSLAPASRAGTLLGRLGDDLTGRRVAAAASTLAGLDDFAREG